MLRVNTKELTVAFRRRARRRRAHAGGVKSRADVREAGAPGTARGRRLARSARGTTDRRLPSLRLGSRCRRRLRIPRPHHRPPPAGELFVEGKLGLASTHDESRRPLQQHHLGARCQTEDREATAPPAIARKRHHLRSLAGPQLAQGHEPVTDGVARIPAPLQEPPEPGDDAGALGELELAARAAEQAARGPQRAAVLAEGVLRLELEAAERADHVASGHRPSWWTIPPTRKAACQNLESRRHLATFTFDPRSRAGMSDPGQAGWRRGSNSASHRRRAWNARAATGHLSQAAQQAREPGRCARVVLTLRKSLSSFGLARAWLPISLEKLRAELPTGSMPVRECDGFRAAQVRNQKPGGVS